MREVAIQHVKTLKYIAINENAKLTTKDQYDHECNFKEGVFANYWTTYSSLKWGKSGHVSLSRVAYTCILYRYLYPVGLQLAHGNKQSWSPNLGEKNEKIKIKLPFHSGSD